MAGFLAKIMEMVILFLTSAASAGFMVARLTGSGR